MSSQDPVGALEALKTMRERGLITQQEHDDRRAAILDRMGTVRPPSPPPPTIIAPANPPPPIAKPAKQQSSLAGCVTLIVIGLGLYFAFFYHGGSPTPAGSNGNNNGGGGGGGAPAAPVTLITLSGSGIKNSSSFTATGPWTLFYTYNCSSFGSQGNFIVDIGDQDGNSVDFPVNELGDSGSSSSSVYSTGTLHLEVNSECSWQVRATEP